MLVGIPLDTLLELVIGAFLTPLIIMVVVWKLWFPKPGKEYAHAKLHKQDVNISATDAGTLNFRRGSVHGPGVFYGAKKHEVAFMHRSSEPWVDKRFSADKIGTWLSYEGMVPQLNFKHLAVLNANRMLHTSNKTEKGEVDFSLLPPMVRESLKECYLPTPVETKLDEDEGRQFTIKGKEYFFATKTELQEAFKCTEQEAALLWEELGTTHKLERRQALLLEPRIMYEANTEMCGPDLLEYVENKAYNEGFNDGKKPLLARALPLLFAVGLILLAIAMAFSGTG